jgi:hypothetical protein
MSNAIAGVNLPANVVRMVRAMLDNLGRSSTPAMVALRMAELYGVLRALECLQRLNAANAGRVYAHAEELASQREKVLAVSDEGVAR